MQFKLISEGIHSRIEPEIFADSSGRSAVRSAVIEACFGRPTKVTVEILAPEAMALIKDFVLAFTVPDGRKVTEIHLEGGEVLRFPLSISAPPE